MTSYRLPLSMNPVITTYLSHAQLLGMLSGNIENQEQWMPWVYNKYINCCFTESPEFKFDVYEEDKYFIKEGVLDILDFPIDVQSFINVLKYTEKDFVDMVKNIIQGGSYVWGIHNEKYISIKPSYQKYDYMHGYMLHGFNDEKQSFLCATYGRSDKEHGSKNYSEFWISYSEYYSSVFQPAFPKLSFRIMRFNKDFKFHINLQEIYNNIYNYLNSISKESTPSQSAETLFGVSAWRRLVLYIKNANIIDIRFTKIFKEHHNLMYNRLKYLYELGIIDHTLCENYIQAVKCSEIAYLLSLKYNLSRGISEKERCLSYISQVINQDCEILPSVLDNLQKTI